MSLLDTVQQDLTEAMKAQNKTKMGALRMLKSALKNAEIEASNHQLDAAAESQILMKLCKQRRESIELFQKNGRPELADTEQAELNVIEAYLPAGIGDAELAALVQEAIQESGSTGPKQMGQVIGLVMKKLAGQAVDGKKVSELVKARLAAAG